MVIYCVCITKMIVRFYLSPSLMSRNRPVIRSMISGCGKYESYITASSYHAAGVSPPLAALGGVENHFFFEKSY